MLALITAAFPDGSHQVTDAFIEAHCALLEVPGEPDLFAYLPAYMAWCVRNQNRHDQTVTDHTIDTIAQIGRAGQESALGQFRAHCNREQREALCDFLQWCSRNISTVDHDQVARAVKRWRSWL